MPKVLPKEQQDLIFEHYESGDFDWLAKKLGKRKKSITEWARKQGLKRKIEVKRRGNLEPLLSGTLESFYWLGFIAADGYIGKNGHLMVSQSIKDRDRVDELAKYLKTTVYEYKQKTDFSESSFDVFRVNVCDKVIGCKIRDMFNIQEDKPKTYTGISVDFINNENQAASFLCGIIDGDGSLHPSQNYKIQCHTSWMNTFNNLLKKLPQDISDHYSMKISKNPSKKNPYLYIYFKKSASDNIRKFAHNNNIPCSGRKFPKDL